MTWFPHGLRLMALAAFWFSLMGALVKVAGAHFPTMEIVLARSVVVLALCAWTIHTRRLGFLGRERRLLLLRGALGFVALSCSYYAVIHLPLAEATVIQYTNPIFTALLAAALLGERLRRADVLFALMSFCGILVVARPPFLAGLNTRALDPFAVGVALAGALFSAGAYVMVRRLRGEAPVVVVFYFALISVIGSIPAAVPTFVMPSGWNWLLLGSVGVSTHLGQLALTRGLQQEAAGRAMSVGYVQIVFASLWGMALFSDFPDRWTISGALLIVLSTFALARTGPRVDPSGTERP